MAYLTINEVKQASPLGIWGNDSCVQCGACCYDYRVNGPQKRQCPNQTIADGKSICAMHEGTREPLCKEFVCRNLQPENPFYERNCQKLRAIASKLGTVPSPERIAQSRTCRIVANADDLRDRQLALITIISDDCTDPLESQGFAPYTGLNAPLGNDYLENTCLTVMQMAMALALRTHPAIEDLLHNYSRDSRFDARPLADAGVLSGLRFLDIGCGTTPAFARCSRALGAEVFTADSHPAWRLCPREADTEQVKDKYHIHVPDLNEPGSLKVLLERTGGALDFVTAATVHPLPDDRHLEEPSNQKLAEIGRALLKADGVYYHDWAANYELFTK